MRDVVKFLNEEPADNTNDVVGMLSQPDQLPNVVEKGLVTPPDQAARVIQLQAKTGLPQGLIERNLDYVESESNKLGFNADEFRKNNPKLSNWMEQDKNRVAVSQYDVDRLASIEQSWAITEIAKQFAGGFVTSAPEMIGAALEWWAPSGTEAERLGKVAKEYWREKGNEWKPDLQGRGIIASTLIEGARQIAPSGIGMIATAINPILGGSLVAATFGGQQAQDTYDKGIEAGISPAEAANAAYLTGLIEGFGETIADVTGAKLLSGAGKALLAANGGVEGAVKIATSPKWAARFAKDWAANAAIQSGTEYAQGYGEAAVEKAYGISKEDPSNAGAEGARIALGMSVLLGIPSAGLHMASANDRAKIGKLLTDDNAPPELRIGAAKFVASDIKSDVGEEKSSQWLDSMIADISSQNSGKIIRAKQNIDAAERGAKFLQSLGENLNGSTILSKSPESVKSYIEHLKKDGDIQNVYVKVDAWDKLFQQESRAAAQEILGSSTQYDEAKSLNADIVIPLEVYAEKLAGTQFHDQLLPDMKVHAGDMTPREADLARKNEDPAIKEEAARIEQEMKAMEPVRKVYDDVYGQMLGMHATRSEAARVALLESQRQAARASRLGVDPWDLWQERPKYFQRWVPSILQKKEVDISLDPLIDQLRAGKFSTNKDIFGESLTEFLKSKGGLQDQGTELSSMDVDVERKRSAKKLVQKDGMTLDHAAEMAAEQGYIDEADINKLLDAIDRETRGESVYALGKENQALLDRDRELNDLNDYLNSIGADLNKMDNAAVRKLIKERVQEQDLYQTKDQTQTEAQDQIIYFGRKGQKFTISKKRHSELVDIRDSAFDIARSIMGEGVNLINSDMSSSMYILFPNGGKIRISDHPLPKDFEIKHGKADIELSDTRDIKGLEEKLNIYKSGEKQTNATMLYENYLRDISSAKQRFLEKIEAENFGKDFWKYAKSYAESDGTKFRVMMRNNLATIGGYDARKFSGDEKFIAEIPDYVIDIQIKKAYDHANMVANNGQIPKISNYPSWLIGNDEDVQERALYQTESNAPPGSASAPPLAGIPEDALGMYSRNENVITLLKKANPSTVLHELGHSWLEELRMDAMREGAPQQLIDDWSTIKAWAKIEDDISVDSHEQFARGIEAYVMEGKSPSAELQSVFGRFKDWLIKIYKNLTALHVEVSPEVRDVFDRLLATDEQIERAREIQGYHKPLLSDAEMTKAEYGAYQRINERAKAEAEDAIRAKAMNELAREQLTWWKQARTVMREEVAADIDALPVYRALSWLRKGVFPDGKTLEGVEPMKLSKAALVQRYGEPFLKSLPKPYIYQEEGGLHPDVAAEYLGFNTGEELVKSLAEAKPRNELIDAETDMRMKAKYGDMMTDGSIADEADFQVNNDRQAEVFMYEMTILKRRGSTKSISPKEVFQNIARSVIQDKKVGDLDPKYYEHAARKAGLEAEKALLGKGMKMGVARNLDLAFEAKQRQLLNLYLFREAAIAKAGIESAQDRFMDMFRKDEKLAKTRNMDMVNAARAISAQHGIGGTEQNAMQYLEQMREYDPATYEDMKMAVDLAVSDAKPFKQLTVSEFGIVQEAIDGLWELSRMSQQITIEGKKLQLKSVIAELAGKMELLGEPKARRGYYKAITKWEKTKIGLLGAKSALRRVEPWVDAMDRGNFNGEFRRYIWQPISDATTHYREMRRRTLERYLEIAKPLDGLITGDKIHSTDLVYTFNGKSELLGALLHTGNESNLQKLLRGRNWGEYNEDGVLDTSRWNAFIQKMHDDKILTKQDWDFVQSIWDLNESLKPDAQKAHKAMYGYYFSEITAQKLITPFGEYRGGYMPAIVDPFAADDAALRADKEALESQPNSFMFPTTGRGFTKSRKDGYAKPLVMDLRYIPQHLDKVLKFSYIEPSVKEIGRLVMNKEFRASMSEYVDTEVVSQMLVPWLQRSARQTVETASMDRTGRLFDKFFKEVRSRTGLQIMTLNATNALQQFTGLSISAIKVKPSFLAPALGRYVRGPSTYASYISDKSEFMRNRVYSQSFEIQEKIDNILLDPTKLEKARDFAVKHGYFMQAGTQHVVDIITWGGAYDQAISEGVDEQVAVKMADSAVRETQGTFAPEDISRFETGSPFMRAFTMFYTYFNMQANLLGTEFGKAMKQGGFAGAGRGLYVYTLGFMIPAVISELIVQAMSGKLTDGDDEGWVDWLAMFFGGQVRTLTAMIPGVGPAVQTGINAFNDKWYDDRMSTSPAVAMIESTVHAPFSIYNAIENDGSQKKAIKDTLTAVGMGLGLPLAPLGRPLGYWSDIEQGKADPSGPVEMTRGLITGRSP